MLSSLVTLKRHLIKCKVKEKLNTDQNQILILQEKVRYLTEQNKILSEQMFQLANKPTTTNKQIVKKQVNLINNLAPYDISERLVQQIAEQEYTEDDFKRGSIGLANFVANKIATNQDGKQKLICTDYARRRFKHLNSDGSDVVEDIGAIHLCKTISKPMKQAITTTYDKIKEELIDEVDIDIARNMMLSNTTRLSNPEFVSDIAKRLVNPSDEESSEKE